MMKTLLSLSVWLGVALAPLSLAAQGRSFARTFGETARDERGYSIVEAGDGGYVIAGSMGGDLGIMKIDSLGNPLWTRTYGGRGYDVANMVRRVEGGYVIAGETDSYGAGEGDAWILRTDTEGDTLWSRVIGGAGYDFAMALHEVDGGDIVAVGGTESFGAGERDGYAIRIGATGDTVWTRTFGGEHLDELFGVVALADGTFIAAGGTYSFGSAPGHTDDIYVVRFDAGGISLWTKTFGGSGYDWADGIAATGDGHVVITGQQNDGDPYLLKIDPAGERVWNRIYSTSSLWEEGRSVAVTPDGGFIVAGRIDERAPTGGVLFQDMSLTRTDHDGAPLWSKRFGGALHDEGYAAIPAGDGGCIAVGFKGISWDAGELQTTADIYVVKSDGRGDISTSGIDLPRASDARVTIVTDPVAGEIAVRSTDPALDDVGIIVTDLLGRTVHSGAMVAGRATIDLAAQPAGTYFLILGDGSRTPVRPLLISR